ncbi:hypothetical protein A2X44_01555 [candidate division CPR3 bacterium GWF2_35_18]|uniref:DUF8173 domain-containing protein n=1 Tax=candidate division CPR3 bacterium GW2011_GWF2_35_18 TaxID=1618350 RepID=A0A0G0BLJ9_UNCC3|nr:MAG: hypothetical protein UR67_C0001G0288 [candidate division CPR3 bacterium GW2011_GWF2_35_18]KKP86481.1 MAG: hypothetical protein UR87_C0018G0010 [candidate division CPR3 bacterium GW2011_GWE2_35_7]OGB63588.1 MAG: hypothetical protein A2X44_01555 [candidate division CPR3 bacterium GWF2_35_18]OGB64696.1 MAG: hypothetical protein A2250_04105 [candidate division CPR3 bacterium RIFOXYA2_FULL_35_13]OGB76624.1 MAG: hypothetical protein A2476_02085 [candidate division CPR3 bacterium RIFOXYC2_FULL
MRNKIFRIFLTIGLLFSIFSGYTFAEESTGSAETSVSASKEVGDVVTLNRNEVVHDDYFAAGEDITLAGTVDGDAALGASEIEVSGKVGGDLLAAGGVVIVSGEIVGDARIAGGQLHISGTFGKNLWVFGGQVTISEDTKIGGSILAAGGTVTIKGKVARNVIAYGGQIDFNGNSGQNVTLTGSIVNVGTSSDISGDLKVIYETQSDISDEAVIKGSTTNEKMNNVSSATTKDFEFFSPAIFGALNLAAKFIAFLSLLLIGLILIILFPKSVTKVVTVLDDNPGNSFVIGLFGFPLFIVLIFFLLLTILGIPLAFVLIALAIVLTYLSSLFVGTWLGKKVIILVLKKEGALIWSMILGLMILELLSFLPLVSVITTIFGMGGLILAFNKVRQGK